MASAKKRVTIKDVAARAGVSYQTVSRVINHSQNVNEETRRRVTQAIADLNYRPSLAARSLPGKRAYVIGFIIPYGPDYLIRDPNLLAQISGADTEANKHGYSIMLSTATDSGSGLQAFERFMRNKVADGALVIETAISQSGGKLLTDLDYPYVTLGYDPNPGGFFVHNDDREGGMAATRYLLQQGHRRIGIINGPPIGAVVALQYRLEGYQQALFEAGLAFDPALMVYGDYTRRGGEIATRKLLSLPEPPTAIFALNDRMAMGAIKALHMVGIRVPEDVAVIGFDDVPTAADFNPSLTTISQSSKEVGRSAARMLFNLISGEPIKEPEIALPTRLIVRQSA